MDNMSIMAKTEQIIAIDGVSGAGKSTLLDILCDELDITGIHCDKMLEDAIWNKRVEIEELFGEKVIRGQEKEYINRNLYWTPSVENRWAYYEIIMPYYEERVCDMTHKLSRCIIPAQAHTRYNEKLGGHMYGVETVMISNSNLWEDAYRRIIVNTAPKLRKERIKTRGWLSDDVRDFDVDLVRHMTYAPTIDKNIQNGKFDYLVQNNVSLDAMKEKMKAIADDIKLAD